MSMLTREAILAADDIRRELVSVPEWGGDVYVKMLTGAERARWEARAVKSGNVDSLEDMPAILLAATVCDEAGALLFTPEDYPALSAKSSSAVSRVFRAAFRLNNLGGDEALEAAKGN